ncbi:MAG: leucyl aminopeptidase family protein [Hyphomicrobiales bacterium]
MQDAKTFLVANAKAAVPLIVVAKENWSRTVKTLSAAERLWAEVQGFAAAPLALLPVADASGRLAKVFVGAPRSGDDPFALGAIASRLPSGTFAFAAPPSAAALVALGWCLELYKYDPFRAIEPRKVVLVAPKGVDAAETAALANTLYAVRDQVNAPANVFGPDALEAAARSLAKAHGAKVSVITGQALAKGFPLIHAVGAASTRAPRLIDITWGSPRAPKVTIVGKGVVFDTGGLDIKPSASMLLMKKDMGGAATIMGLARLIMAAKLPLRLRVLLPVVENAIAGNAFRPGDVFKSRKGITVEIGNTDAEGRLILADALALADEEAPDLLIDMATLTGAARVALGPDLPPFYTDDDRLAAELSSAAAAENDPLWRLPLWRPYGQMIETPIADLNNSGAGGFAGSITAALFLRRFVEKAKAHVHFDIFAWVPTAKPGRPKGGEAQALRAVFAVLRQRYGK